MQLTWLPGAPSRPVSVHRRAVGRRGLGSPATQLMRAVRQPLRAVAGTRRGRMTYSDVKQTGSEVVLRGIYRGRVWHAQSTIVVQDSPTQTLLLLEPGSEWAHSSGYPRWRYGDLSQGGRWDEASNLSWTMVLAHWVQRRFLMLLEPERFYSICLLWQQSTGEFERYYVNFQLPYRRSNIGFDTLDLDLDLLVERDMSIRWKDSDEYEEALSRGLITPEWREGVEVARAEVLERIRRKEPPFDGSLLSWRPDSTWRPSRLPSGWETV